MKMVIGENGCIRYGSVEKFWNFYINEFSVKIDKSYCGLEDKLNNDDLFKIRHFNKIQSYKIYRQPGFLKCNILFKSGVFIYTYSYDSSNASESNISSCIENFFLNKMRKLGVRL